MGGRNLPSPVAIAPDRGGQGIETIGLMLRICGIFCVDKNSGNGGGQAVEKSAEGVKGHVAEKFLGETRSFLSAVSRQKILLDNNYREKSKLSVPPHYEPLVGVHRQSMMSNLFKGKDIRGW